MGLRIHPDILSESLCSLDAEITRITQSVKEVDLKIYRTRLEDRLKALVSEREQLRIVLVDIEKKKLQVAANINAFNGAIEECERCLGDIPK